MQAPGLFDIPDRRGKFGLVHNLGQGGATVVSLLRRPEFYKPGGPDGRTRYLACTEVIKMGVHTKTLEWDIITRTRVAQLHSKMSIRSRHRSHRIIFCGTLSFEWWCRLSLPWKTTVALADQQPSNGLILLTQLVFALVCVTMYRNNPALPYSPHCNLHYELLRAL